MAGMGLPPNIACPWVGDKGRVCPLPSGKVLCVWVSPSPAISQSPRGQLYGWLPLSNAYGIFFVANYTELTKYNIYRYFFLRNFARSVEYALQGHKHFPRT